VATDLGPDYDCVHCRRPEQDLPNGCPNCPLTIALATARDEAEQESRDVLGIDPEPEDLTRCDRVHAAVAKALVDNDNRTSPEWSWELAHLARVLLYEQARERLIEQWQMNQRLKSRGRRK
jgi:hypothetical protein